MAEPFLGEIRLMAFSFAPKNYSFCDGQLMELTEHMALYSILGTTFGGDGSTNFKLPDLRTRTPVGLGISSSSNFNYIWGDQGGDASVTLKETDMPIHGHRVLAVTEANTEKEPGDSAYADSSQPEGNMMASMKTTSNGMVYRTYGDPLRPLSPNAVSPTGGGGAHNNIQPSVMTNFCIALSGQYPVRN